MVCWFQCLEVYCSKRLLSSASGQAAMDEREDNSWKSLIVSDDDPVIIPNNVAAVYLEVALAPVFKI